jgi:hypothetical protein
MPSRVVHFELPADDPDRCAQFYADAFGWKIEKWGGPTDYWLVTTGEPGEVGIDGGIGRRQNADDQTTNTLDVADLDGAIEKVVAGRSPTRSTRCAGWGGSPTPRTPRATRSA